MSIPNGTTSEGRKKKNFTNDEKRTFLSLIKSERILLSRTGGINTCARKNKEEAWTRLTRRFNEIKGHSRRDVKQLKKLWNNLKFERKSKIAGVNATKASGGDVLEEILDKDVKIELADSESENQLVDADYDSFGLFSSNASSLNEEENISSPASRTLQIQIVNSYSLLSKSDEIFSEEADGDKTDGVKLPKDIVDKSQKNSSFLDKFEDESIYRKKLMLQEHEMKMKLYREKLEILRMRKEYYRLKTNGLPAVKHLLNSLVRYK